MFSSAAWIWGEAESRPDTYYDFRLTVRARVGCSYRLALSCDTDYALYGRDGLIAFGQYADYPSYKVYDTVCLDGALTEGENELCLTVWYQGIDSQTYIRKPAGVIFVLTEDGAPVLVSSPSVLCRRAGGYLPHRCQAITSQLGLGYAYDFGRRPGKYAPSVAVRGLSQTLYPRPISALTLAERFVTRSVEGGGYVRQGEEQAPERWMQTARLAPRPLEDADGETLLSRREGEDGIYLIVDLGRETAGFLSLSLTVDVPCEAVVGWGEHLSDGRCRTAIRHFAVPLTLTVGRNEALFPFRRLGCRYLQLFAAAPHVRIAHLSLCETAYPVTVKPYRGKDPLRKRIYEVAVNTLRQCMHEHYEDCPWREQALYTLDSRNQMLCGYYAFGETAFPRACLSLMTHGRREDGLLNLCFPAGLDYPIPAFSLIYFLQMREYMDHTGDLAFIKENYAFLRSLIHTFLARRRENGLIESFADSDKHWNFYEWSEGLCGCLGQQDEPSLEAPLNAFLSLALQALAAMAEAIGREADATFCRRTAETVNRALAVQFFRPETGLFESFNNRRHGEYSVLTNSLCLLCGAVDDLDASTILRILTANGPADTGLTVIPNTLSMNGFRFDALLHRDAAVYREVVLREIDGSYRAMLEEGATSFWETALGEKDFGGAGSLCHGWTALPIYYYSILENEA